MNDSQKPAASGANASSNNTAISDSDQIRPAPTRRALSLRQREYGEHQPGTLGGHGKSGEQRIGAGGSQG